MIFFQKPALLSVCDVCNKLLMELSEWENRETLSKKIVIDSVSEIDIVHDKINQ